MKKSDLKVLPIYFDRYINLVPDLDIMVVLKDFDSHILEERKESFMALGDQVYAPHKWTVKDILQHIIDTERIFAYRALRISRKDKTPLPGFDENSFAVSAHATTRSVDALIDEFSLVRRSTIALFDSLNEQDLIEEGIASNNTISTLALGFTLTGHLIHHMNIVKERYFPLLEK